MAFKKRKLVDIGLIILFLFSFSCFLFWLSNNLREPDYTSWRRPENPIKDQFDSSLIRLNSVDKITSYCDSIYQARFPQLAYPEVVSETLRKRFFHDYSYYNLANNSFGVIFAPLVGNGAAAVVIPNDIAKYPNAACSQQSILGMEIFKQKGYKFRKVSMFDSVKNVGHFAYEIYYGTGWHFFDTDQEPDAKILGLYGRPSAAFLAENPSIVLAAYSKRDDPELFKRLLMNAKTGPINKFPAPNAYMYQVVTKFLSYFGWLLFLAIILVRQWVKRTKKFTPAISAAKKEETVAVFS